VKLALYDRGNGGRGLGVVDNDYLVDVTDWAGAPGCCPIAALIERAAAEPPPLTGQRIPLAEVRWLPPALGGSAVLCVGVNYAEHARSVAERSGTVITAATNPAVFSKYWPSLVGHGEPLVRPQVSTWLDFEGELVVVIGKHCRAVSRSDALDVIAGYTIGQDGTLRDWQRNSATPTAGKNFYHTGALGPWIVTSDELPDPAALRLKTTVNGEVLQDAPTADLIHDVPALIEHITTFMPLAPGDVIFTGTPAGCLADRGNDRWLVSGDVVSVEISGIGRLTNYVIAEDFAGE
jgi:2-keto-4-pentenoate hydratase/2-oxohepta-3-ene-1,7-dioic acid hydratase in catechol pathway